MKKPIIALYLRISRRDADMSPKHNNFEDQESISIQNQRSMLWRYMKHSGDFLMSISNLEDYAVREFTDDGYSGTSMERPAIKELLELSKSGNIYCIIVKDISRFGRNYIDVGTYLEEIFPYIGVRFISINDAYDSDKQKGNIVGIDVSFKGIIHDYYCKELSKKAKIAHRQQVEKGSCIMAKPPYGYWKSKDEKGKLIIDEKTSKVVTMIYQMFMDGISAYQITKILNDKEIPSPNKRLEQHGMIKFDSDYSKNLCWGSHAVLSILKSQIYIGNMVGNKVVKPKISSHSCTRLDKKQWIIVKDTHEPIIDKETFDKVQTILQVKGKNTKPNTKQVSTEYLFKGKLICGSCHSTLVRNGEHKGIMYYTCNKCRQTSQQIVTTIHSNTLEAAILNGLADKISLLRKVEEVEQIGVKVVKNNETIIEEMGRTVEMKRKMLPLLYQRYIEGNITKEQFAFERDQSESTARELKDLKEAYQMTENRKYQETEKQNSLEECRDPISYKQVNNELVNKYISKIMVYGKENFDIQWI